MLLSGAAYTGAAYRAFETLPDNSYYHLDLLHVFLPYHQIASKLYKLIIMTILLIFLIIHWTVQLQDKIFQMAQENQGHNMNAYLYYA